MVRSWEPVELAFEPAESRADAYGHEFLTATFEHESGEAYEVPGFRYGDGTVRVRFAPPEPGRWDWETDSTDPGLRESGTVEATAGGGETALHEHGYLVADVESFPEGEPIPLSILPDGVERGEDHGDDSDESGYSVFYTTVAANTAWDVVTVLQDLYRLTNERRYLEISQRLLDQFFEHGEGGRPALKYRDGEWIIDGQTEEFKPGRAFNSSKCLVARMALRHDLVAPAPRYEDRMVRWAEQIDEESVVSDQSAMDVMVTAHYYTGEREWLERGYAMALRAWAAIEHRDYFHQCTTGSRSGSKFLKIWQYQPLLGGADWGTRGQLPVRVLRHRHDGRDRLPPTVGFRTWRRADDELGFEAVNDGDDAVEWSVVPAEPMRFVDEEITAVRLGDTDAAVDANRLRLEPDEATTGTIALD